MQHAELYFVKFCKIRCPFTHSHFSLLFPLCSLCSSKTLLHLRVVWHWDDYDTRAHKYRVVGAHTNLFKLVFHGVPCRSAEHLVNG